MGRESGGVQTGNNRHGYCKIYCFSSFRLVVMLDEKHTIREAYGRGGARSFSTGVNECTFFSFLSLPRRDRYCPSRLPSLLFASARSRLFRSIVTASVFLDQRRHASSSDCLYTNYVFRNGTINVVLWVVNGRVARC